MSRDDWFRLILYRNKKGPLNPSLRMEAGFALVASSVLNAAGMKKVSGQSFEQADFMFKPTHDEAEEAVSVDEAFAMFTSLARSSK